jgi:hypothetical protein
MGPLYRAKPYREGQCFPQTARRIWATNLNVAAATFRDTTIYQSEIHCPSLSITTKQDIHLNSCHHHYEILKMSVILNRIAMTSFFAKSIGLSLGEIERLLIFGKRQMPVFACDL